MSKIFRMNTSQSQFRYKYKNYNILTLSFYYQALQFIYIYQKMLSNQVPNQYQRQYQYKMEYETENNTQSPNPDININKKVRYYTEDHQKNLNFNEAQSQQQFDYYPSKYNIENISNKIESASNLEQFKMIFQNHEQKEWQYQDLKFLKESYNKILRETDKIKTKLQKLKEVRYADFKSNMNLIQQINRLKSILKQKQDIVGLLTYEKTKMSQQINGNKKDWYQVVTQTKVKKKLEQQIDQLRRQIKKIKVLDINLERQEDINSKYRSYLEKKISGYQLSSGRKTEDMPKSYLKFPPQRIQITMCNLREQIRILQNLLQKQKDKQFSEITSLKKKITNLRVLIKQNEDKMIEVKKQTISLSKHKHQMIGIKSNSVSRSNSFQNNLNIHNRSKSPPILNFSYKHRLQKRNLYKNIFVGNSFLKQQSLCLQDIQLKSRRLNQIVFFGNKAQQIQFRCKYQNMKQNNYNYGILHSNPKNNNTLQTIATNQIQIFIDDLKQINVSFTKQRINGLLITLKSNNLSILVGVQYQSDEKQLLKIENTSINFQDKILSGIGSYWYNNDLMGINFKYKKRVKVNNFEIKNARAQYYGYD